MSKLVVLNIVDGDFENGFPVFLEIATEDQYRLAEANGRLPAASELLKQYKNWQLPYNSLVSNLRSSRIHVAGSTTSIPQIKEASRNLKSSLNDWLNSPQMHSISRTLYQNLNDKSEEIRVIIKTQNSDLQRLPWHSWDDFFQYYLRSEVALSLPVKKQKKIIYREKARILAVFGKREGVGNITEIKLNRDLELLEQHLSQDAHFTPLIEPTLEDLYEQFERRPPNLFFFAGHSSSEENGTRGLIELNRDETISIDDLKPALREAVEEGLQLAIFNSCDGLGIARELADLHIPQIIVMREPVPDVVAQKFLQRFLEAFVGERSVNLAVRRARERIHHLEVKYPGVTWLPIVFQNPAEPSLTGNEFRRIATGVEPTQANPTTEASQPENQSQILWMPSVIIQKTGSSGSIANPPSSQQPAANQGFSRICSQGHENPIANRFCIHCGEALEAPSTAVPISNAPPPTAVPISNAPPLFQEPLLAEEVQSYAIAPVGLGSILKGRYRIIRQLGRGGFGQTYLAEDIDRLTTTCVVKQLNIPYSEPTVNQIARRLFETEARVLKQLGKHDQITQLLAYFEENQEFYLIQEFIDGEDLSREITLGKQMSESYVISLLQEVLEILEFVHQRGVIHRDIKPSNLIRRKQDSKLVLIDFGAVKQISNQTFSSQGQSIAIGTPGYIPPEQANGKPQFSSDIYELGILCIQALTGVHPRELSRDPNTAEISWHSQANVSPELARILDKMVRYDFSQRYQSATEVLQDLQRSIFLSPTKIIYRSRIWKLIAAFIAVVVLAGLAFIIFAPKSSIPNQQSPTSEQEKK
ncbi:MAG: protein kinase [Brasilonema octagenarum HA4186-MV1]|jgi:serine/threonine-protein kinase|nr:protein kinase [Brasilonema octagenarum HA4186-MV1]